MNNKEPKRISLLTITLVASMGGFLFGFDMAVISGVLPLVQKQFILSAAQEGWFVSSALLGCIIGVAFSGELSDRFGRKKPSCLNRNSLRNVSIGLCTYAILILGYYLPVNWRNRYWDCLKCSSLIYF